MNPNSGNQRWSKWAITMTPGRVVRPDVAADLILPSFRRFARMVFGSASEMRVVTQPGSVTFEVRSEGHPAHDPSYVAHVRHLFTKFFAQFGPGTTTQVTAKVEAGSLEDGTPPEQLVILPSLTVQE